MTAGRVLAIDPGTVRVGLARTDESGTIAEPLGTMAAEPRETLVARLAAVAGDLGATEIAVGHPRRLDGSEGEEAKAARGLAHELRQVTGAKVTLVDERLTSVAAERSLTAMEVRGRRRRLAADRVAATLILQQYLAGRRG